MKTYIVGHTNPDTDAICSALVWEAFCRDRGEDATAVRLGEMNNETAYVLSRISEKKLQLVSELPEGSSIVLVDHNDPQQSIAHREKYTITHLIDHHAFGTFSTPSPLYVRVEPVGCTCTVMYHIFKEHNYTPSQETAYMMISAILSDTLHFRSPTTTDADKKACLELQSLANIKDLGSHAMAMFDAKSDLGDMSAHDIVQLDYKQYTFGNKVVAIGVMETTNPNYALQRKQELLSTMQQLTNEQSLDGLLFCIVDIINETNTCFVIDEQSQDIVRKAFDVSTVDNVADLGTRISRKKQLVPAITAVFG